LPNFATNYSFYTYETMLPIFQVVPKYTDTLNCLFAPMIMRPTQHEPVKLDDFATQFKRTHRKSQPNHNSVIQ